jgi:WD40 repeat protein
MSSFEPRYELARVYSDGTQESAEILPITRVPWDAKMNRRGFLGVGVTAASVLAALGNTETVLGADEKKLENDKFDSDSPGLDCGEAQAHTKGVSALTISPDGRILVSGGDDHIIKLWSLPEGNLLKTLEGHPGGRVNALVINPEGNILASGCSDKTIKLWRLPDGKLLKTLTENTAAVVTLVITPDGKFLIAAGGVHTINMWSLPNGDFFKTLHDRNEWPTDLAITSDGKTLATGGGIEYTINLWNLPEGNLLKTINSKIRVGGLAITPDDKILISGSDQGSVSFWALPDGRLLKTIEDHTYGDTELAISPDGKILASGGYGFEHSIKLWELPTGRLIKLIHGHMKYVYALAITPDGKILASGSEDHTIKLWSLPEGRFKTCLIDLKVSPDTSKGTTYEAQNAHGQIITYTLPCGSPIPAGAVCTCNCVSAGSFKGGGESYTYCTCNKVCVCIPVYYCQAHKLLHTDSVVRLMAEELLLLMGTSGMSYLRWAAAEVTGDLQHRIYQIILEIHHGRLPNPVRWPSIAALTQLLVHSQQIVTLMAAQLLLNRRHPEAHFVTDTLRADAEAILAAGQTLHQTVREQVVAFEQTARSDSSKANLSPYPTSSALDLISM